MNDTTKALEKCVPILLLIAQAANFDTRLRAIDLLLRVQERIG